MAYIKLCCSCMHINDLLMYLSTSICGDCINVNNKLQYNKTDLWWNKNVFLAASIVQELPKTHQWATCCVRMGQSFINHDLTCRHTRDFSSRYCSILAPSMAPLLLKWMSIYFPKRLELSLRMVLALPKAKFIYKLYSEVMGKSRESEARKRLVVHSDWHSRTARLNRFFPDMHIHETIFCIKTLQLSDLRGWAWPPGPAARSRSVGHWWLRETAGSALCSLSSQLQTHRCNTHMTVKHTLNPMSWLSSVELWNYNIFHNVFFLSHTLDV